MIAFTETKPKGNDEDKFGTFIKANSGLLQRMHAREDVAIALNDDHAMGSNRGDKRSKCKIGVDGKQRGKGK